MSVDRMIAEVAGGQHGLVTLDQLRQLGLSEDHVRYRERVGRLERLEPRLFRLPGAPERWEQRVLGACLSVGADAVACRRAAAHLWSLWSGPEPPVEIAVPRPRSPRWVSARVHRSTDTIGAHRTHLAGIPLTTVPRTLVDLGAVAPDWRVEDAVDRAVVRELTRTTDLEAILDNVARKGRRGVASLRRAILDITDGLESVLEAKLFRLISRSELPDPVIQHVVPLGPHDTARIDFAYPDVKLAIEADGRETHLTREAFDRERERDEALERMGWKVLHFTWTHVTRYPSYVIAVIGDWLRRLRQGPRPRS